MDFEQRKDESDIQWLIRVGIAGGKPDPRTTNPFLMEEMRKGLGLQDGPADHPEE